MNRSGAERGDGVNYEKLKDLVIEFRLEGAKEAGRELVLSEYDAELEAEARTRADVWNVAADMLSRWIGALEIREETE